MNRKKLAGAAVAALVGLGMLGAVAPASATETDKATITITGDAVADRTLTAYKLATYGPPTVEGGVLKGFDLTTASTPAGLKAAIAAYLTRVTVTADTDNLVLDYDGITDPLQWVALNWTNDPADVAGNPGWDDTTSVAPKVRALANWLASQASTLELVSAGTAANGVITVTEGLFLVLDTSGGDDKLTVSLPMIVGTQFMNGGGQTAQPVTMTGGPSGQIVVKGDLVEIDKDIVGAGTDSGFPSAGGDALSGSEDEDATTASTGDTVGFQIRTNVPLYPDTFVSPVFKIHDTWSDGLEPDKASLAVTAGGQAVDPSEYSVVWTAAVVDNDGNEPDTSADAHFVLTLTNPKAANLAGKVIEVTYDAKVVANAPDAGKSFSWDTNTAKVEFTHKWALDTSGNPTTGGGTTDETAGDEVDIYTFPLQLIKADLNARTTFLQATFEMYAAGNTTTPIGKVQTNGAGTAAFVTDMAGNPKGFAGDAWYLVKETTPPTGYTDLNKKVAQFWVYIDTQLAEKDTQLTGDGKTNPVYYFAGTDTTPSGKPSTSTIGSSELSKSYVFPKANDGDTATDLDVLVLNAKSASNMPQTGGQILMWFALAGALGLGAATFAVIGVRKSRTRSTRVA